MMDESISNKIEIEQIQVTPEHEVTFADMLGTIKQSVYEFREMHGDSTDAELPVILEYESNGQTISLLSNRPSTITVQVSSSTDRLSYEYDPTEEFAVTVHHFTEHGEIPTESFGLLPTVDNTHRLLSIHAYIQDAAGLTD